VQPILSMIYNHFKTKCLKKGKYTKNKIIELDHIVINLNSLTTGKVWKILMQTTNEVFFEVMGNIGLITLNRQHVLNALSHSMLCQLEQQLVLWETMPAVQAVVVRAAPGRAFSAGGDIRSVYENRLQQNVDFRQYFLDEYRLNKHIFHYTKPYIALLNGITMGGGAGISIHGSYRVATENIVFAMPETGIGFFPDVGASYFLTRLPYHFGFYLGLTGARLAYNDCYALGLVNTVIAPNAQEQLINMLAQTALENTHTIDQIIKQFSIPVPPSTLWMHQNEIDVCFSKNTIEEIINALEINANDWCKKVAEVLKTKSPLSLKVTLDELKKRRKTGV